MKHIFHYAAVIGVKQLATDTNFKNRHNQLKAFQVNEELMSKANHEALFMHCLPAHRNEEATSGVLDGKNSVIFDERSGFVGSGILIFVNFLKPKRP